MKGLRKQTENTEDTPLPGLSHPWPAVQLQAEQSKARGRRLGTGRAGSTRTQERKSGLGTRTLHRKMGSARTQEERARKERLGPSDS